MTAFRMTNAGVPEDFFEVMTNILRKQAEERGCTLSDEGVNISIKLDAGMNGDDYTISDAGEIVSASRCGLLAGLGRYLQDGSFDGCGSFSPSEKNVSFHPQKAIRGMYFATHFYNFYHVAPINEVYDVIDTLALRGCNALAVWYDMHHYTGIDSTESREMIERIKLIFRYAQKIGMKLCMTMLANEAFSGTPNDIKADWHAINGYKSCPVGHFHEEICPSNPKGMNEIMRQRRLMLEAFADTPLDYLFFWPYDQGGCTCSKCAPWGANGFLKIAPEFQKLANEIMPSARLICSTWGFDSFVDGEFDAFRKRMETGEFDFFAYYMDYYARLKQLPDYLLRGENLRGKRTLAFQEISMRGSVPWGGFGTNALPQYMEEKEKRDAGYYDGGFPYSEGIFDDINKALILGLQGGRYANARDVLMDYARYEFCAPDPDAFADLVFDMETTLYRTRYNQNGEEVNYLRSEPKPDDTYYFSILNPEKIDSIYQKALSLDRSIPERMRSCWKWRIVYLRAVIDHELIHNDGKNTPLDEECFAELTKIYHAEEADYCVAPPSEESMRLNRGGFLL